MKLGHIIFFFTLFCSGAFVSFAMEDMGELEGGSEPRSSSPVRQIASDGDREMDGASTGSGGAPVVAAAPDTDASAGAGYGEGEDAGGTSYTASSAHSTEDTTTARFKEEEGEEDARASLDWVLLNALGHDSRDIPDKALPTFIKVYGGKSPERIPLIFIEHSNLEELSGILRGGVLAGDSLYLHFSGKVTISNPNVSSPSTFECGRGHTFVCEPGADISFLSNPPFFLCPPSFGLPKLGTELLMSLFNQDSQDSPSQVVVAAKPGVIKIEEIVCSDSASVDCYSLSRLPTPPSLFDLLGTPPKERLPDGSILRLTTFQDRLLVTVFAEGDLEAFKTLGGFVMTQEGYPSLFFLFNGRIGLSPEQVDAYDLDPSEQHYYECTPRGALSVTTGPVTDDTAPFTTLSDDGLTLEYLANGGALCPNTDFPWLVIGANPDTWIVEQTPHPVVESVTLLTFRVRGGDVDLRGSTG